MNCSEQVARGEYVWKIAGMSWLKNALWADEGDTLALSTFFMVGCARFALVYSPYAGHLPYGHRGSLGIFYNPLDNEEMSLQYRFWVAFWYNEQFPQLL